MNLKEAEEQIVQTLRNSGHRITLPRRTIIRTILSSKQPLSAGEVHEQIVQQDQAINKTTIYRELQNLASLKLIRSMTFEDGTRRYQALPKGHTHHIVCTNCRSIDDMEMSHDLDEVEKSIQKQKKFKVTNHSLEFYGICTDCQ